MDPGSEPPEVRVIETAPARPAPLAVAERVRQESRDGGNTSAPRPALQRRFRIWLSVVLLGCLALLVVALTILLIRSWQEKGELRDELARVPRPFGVELPGVVKQDGLRTVDLQANDLAYDPVRGHLYAAVSSAAPQGANTIAALDPATGALVWSVNVGSDPGVLAMSRDAKVLWVGLRGAPAIQRIDLDKRTCGPLLPLGKSRNRWELFAEYMQVIPEKPDSVVVSHYRKNLIPKRDHVAVYDNGVARPQRTSNFNPCNCLAYSDDPGILFGYDNESTEFGLRRLAVDEGGVRELDVYEGVLEGFRANIIYAGGRIYSTSGGVVDAQTGKRIGTIPAKGPLTVDLPRKRAYFLVEKGKALEAYDIDTLAQRESCFLPNVTDAQGSLTQIGGNALGFRTERQIVFVPLTNLR